MDIRINIGKLRIQYKKQFHDSNIMEGTSIAYSGDRYIIITDDKYNQLFAIDHQNKEILYSFKTLLILLNEKNPSFEWTDEKVRQVYDVNDLIGHVMNDMYKLPNYTPSLHI